MASLRSATKDKQFAVVVHKMNPMADYDYHKKIMLQKYYCYEMNRMTKM